MDTVNIDGKIEKMQRHQLGRHSAINDDVLIYRGMMMKK